MPTFVPASTGEPWINGVTYRLTYDVDHIKLFGYDVPDELIPVSVREYLAKKQISQAVEKLTGDPRFEVLGYEYQGRTFTIVVVARDNPFPIAVVVVGIIAVAILFGIALVTKSVEKLVVSVGDTADKIGPVATTAISTSILVAVGVAGFLLVRRNL